MLCIFIVSGRSSLEALDSIVAKIFNCLIFL